ncbi:hypothetical protein [Aequorivita antarctica]|uniref:hypothetical protein n=1 Tax=Aequorivita antarctica TaxID=153266 RepID=UPI000DD0881D|nr:hypothetical protein [Aequorivita antarctica]
MKAKTAVVEFLSKYQAGYDNSSRNGFLSHSATNIPSKWNETFENSIMQERGKYDFHGVFGNIQQWHQN